MNDGVQQQPLHIDENIPLLALDLLGSPKDCPRRTHADRSTPPFSGYTRRGGELVVQSREDSFMGSALLGLAGAKARTPQIQGMALAFDRS
jgi:hypothetical protein